MQGFIHTANNNHGPDSSVVTASALGAVNRRIAPRPLHTKGNMVAVAPSLTLATKNSARKIKEGR